MKTITFLILFSLFLLANCGEKTVKVDTDGKENFDAFYERFYKDSIFQLQRIEFPMGGLSSDGKEKIWDESNWKTQISIKKEDPDIKVILQTDEVFVKEKIIYQNAFLAERHYNLDPSGKRWLLVYYADMHIPTNKSDRLSSGQVDSLGSDQENIDTNEVNVTIDTDKKTNKTK